MSQTEKRAWIALGWLALLSFVYFCVGGVAAWFLMSLSFAAFVYLARREQRSETLASGPDLPRSDGLSKSSGQSMEVVL